MMALMIVIYVDDLISSLVIVGKALMRLKPLYAKILT